MATSYHIFCDPEGRTFTEMANEFAQFSGATLAPKLSGYGRPAFDVYLPDRNRFLAHSALPGARERFDYDGPTRADFMAWDEPGQHTFFDDPTDDAEWQYRDYGFEFSLDVFFEEDTPEMRAYAWQLAEHCATRWPTILWYNLETLWARGNPNEPLHVLEDLTNRFVSLNWFGTPPPEDFNATPAGKPELWR